MGGTDGPGGPPKSYKTDGAFWDPIKMPKIHGFACDFLNLSYRSYNSTYSYWGSLVEGYFGGGVFLKPYPMQLM